MKALLFSLFGFGSLVAAGLASTAPVGFYPGEDSGSDLSSSHRDATIPATADAHFADGKVQRGFLLSPTSYVDFGTWFNYESFTIGFWINPAATQADGASVMKYYSAAGSIFEISYGASDGSYTLSVGDGSAPVTFALTPGTWQYVALTRDAVTFATKVYVNGVAQGQATGQTDLDYDSNQGLRFGDLEANQPWNGVVDEVRIWDRALPGEEVKLYSAAGVDLTVPATASPWNAGATAANGGGDGPAAPIGGIAVTPDQVLSFTVAGSVNYDTDTPTDPPDGSEILYHAAENGIAGCSYPANALLGVFLDDSDPGSTDAPQEDSYFGDTNSQDYQVGTPQLKQVFFIGDGLQSTGGLQSVTVPTGATRLYLATGDGAGWYNNVGSFSVHVIGANQTQTGGGTAHLTIHQQASSNSDPTGALARYGDVLQYDLTFVNDGSATAKNLQVATLIPDHLVTDQAISASSKKGTNRVILTSGNTSQLFPGGTFQNTARCLPADATITTVVDAKTLLISEAALKTDTFSTKVQYGSQKVQFQPGEVTPSAFGQIVNVADLMGSQTQWAFPSEGQVAPNDQFGHPRKAIRWTVGDLEAGFQQFVRYQVQINSGVLVDSDITSNNLYQVYSTSGDPVDAADAGTSNAATFSVKIRGPIKITAVPGSATVQPGGLFSITFTVQNLGATLQQNAAAIVDLPDGARYENVYPDVDSKGVLRPGISSLSAQNKVLAKEPAGFACGYTTPGLGTPNQIIVQLGNLRPNAQATFRVTMQAQWANPTDVPHLVTDRYGAAFLNADAYKTIATARAKGSSADLLAFILVAGNHVAGTQDDSGPISLPLAGSLAGAPKLALVKLLQATLAKQITDSSGVLVNTAEAGDELTFVLLASNTGPAAAEDVYLADSILEHASYIDGSAAILTTTPSSKASKLKVVAEDSTDGVHHGVHLRFEGLQLLPNDIIAITYTIKVDDKTLAPAVGTLLDPAVAQVEDADGVLREATSSIGTSSQPETPFGFYLNEPVEVSGTVQFAPPDILTLFPKPHISTSPSDSVTALKAFYARRSTAKDPHPDTDLPLTNPTDITTAIPGTERYYIKYTNLGAKVNHALLDVPLPAHTAFVRAEYVNLKNAAGQDWTTNVLGTIAPKLGNIVPPTASNHNTVTFPLGTLAKNADGWVLVEVVVTPEALDPAGSLLGLPGDRPVRLYTDASHQATSAFPSLALASPQAPPSTTAFHLLDTGTDIPEVGLLKIVPQVAPAGGQFTQTFVVFNKGATASGTVTLHVPVIDGATLSVANYTTAYNGQSNFLDDDNIFTWDSLPANAAVAVTMTMNCTAEPHGAVIENKSFVHVPYVGDLHVGPSTTSVGGHVISASTAAMNITTIAGAPLHTYHLASDQLHVIDLGAGHSIVQGPSMLVGGPPSNLLSQWDGYSVMGGSDAPGGINVNGTNIRFLLDHYSDGEALRLLSVSPATVVVPAGSLFLLPPNGVGMIAGGGLISGANAGIVAQGGGNIVAQGGGNIVAQGGGNIVAQGGGNIVAQGGGNAVPGATIVAQGGGNIVAQGGGNIVAQGGGNVVLASPSGSSGIVAQGGGNIVAQGGGNIVAQGGGN